MKLARQLAAAFGLTRLTPLERAARELENAKCDHLEACAAREQAIALESLYEGRITRLSATVANLAKEDSYATDVT